MCDIAWCFQLDNLSMLFLSPYNCYACNEAALDRPLSHYSVRISFPVSYTQTQLNTEMSVLSYPASLDLKWDMRGPCCPHETCFWPLWSLICHLIIILLLGAFGLWRNKQIVHILRTEWEGCQIKNEVWWSIIKFQKCKTDPRPALKSPTVSHHLDPFCTNSVTKGRIKSHWDLMQISKTSW